MLLAIARLPSRHAPSADEIETAEQHRELGAVEHDAIGALADPRHAEAAAREALVIEDETASIPKQDLDAINTTTDEDEEVSFEWVHLEACAHERDEAVVAAPEIHGLDGEIDLGADGDAEHQLRSAATSDAT